MLVRLNFSELGTYGLTDMDLAPCCAWSASQAYFILCDFHAGYVAGFTAGTRSTIDVPEREIAEADQAEDESPLEGSASNEEHPDRSPWPRSLFRHHDH